MTLEDHIRRGWIQATHDRAQGEIEHVDRLLAFTLDPEARRRLKNRRYMTELRRDEARAAQV